MKRKVQAKKGASAQKPSAAKEEGPEQRGSFYGRSATDGLTGGGTSTGPKGRQLRPGDYQGFHAAMADTRTERMLDAYESYSSVWAANLKH